MISLLQRVTLALTAELTTQLLAKHEPDGAYNVAVAKEVTLRMDDMAKAALAAVASELAHEALS